MQTRCSSLDLLLSCPTSQAPTDHPYHPELAKEEANLGTAKHKALASTARGETVDLSAIAHEYSVAEDDLRAAVRVAFSVMEEARSWFAVPPIVDTELQVDGGTHRGTADVLLRLYSDAGEPHSYDAPLEQMVVIDWKTGWGDDEHPAQLAGYASAARAQYGMPTSGVVTVVEAWLRQRERRIRHYSATELDAFVASIDAAHAQVGKVVRPQAGCRWCQRQLVCEPRHDYVRASSMAIAKLEKGVAITRTQLGGLHDQYRAVMAAARLYESMLKQELEVGPITLPDGRRIEMQSVESRVVDAGPAIGVLLSHGFTAEDLQECLSASRSGIESAARRIAGKGKGAGLLRQINADLDKAGAVRTETSMRKFVVEPEVKS